MKKITFSFLLFTLALLNASAQTNTFFKSFNSGGSILWYSAAPTVTGYIYVGTKGTDLVWAKADTSGTITACNTYHTSFDFTGQYFLVGNGHPVRSMVITYLPGDNILVTCPYGNNGLGLLKINAGGSVAWVNKCTMPSISRYTLTSVSLSNSGKYAWITGQGYVGKTNTGIIIKADSSGNIALSKSLLVDSAKSGAGGFYELEGMAQDKADNSYILISTGAIGAFGYGRVKGIWLKTDSLLNKKWARNGPSLASSIDVHGNKLYALQFYQVYTTGTFRYNNINIYDTAASTYSYVQFPEAQAACTELKATADGGFLTYGSRSDGFYHSTVIKFNDSNKVQWAMYDNLSTRDMEQISSLMPTKDGGYILSGDASTNSFYTLEQGYIVKTDSLGAGICFNTSFSYLPTNFGPYNNTSIDSVSINTLSAYDSALSITTAALADTALSYCYNGVLAAPTINLPATEVNVYPNPSHGVFIIEMNSEQLKVNSEVEVYNMLGEKVYSQYSLPNTKYSIDLSNQPAGIYLYRILSGDNKLIASGKLAIQ